MFSARFGKSIVVTDHARGRMAARAISEVLLQDLIDLDAFGSLAIVECMTSARHRITTPPTALDRRSHPGIGFNQFEGVRNTLGNQIGSVNVFTRNVIERARN